MLAMLIAMLIHPQATPQTGAIHECIITPTGAHCYTRQVVPISHLPRHWRSVRHG